MATTLKAADIEKAIRALIAAQKTNLGIEVTVPVAYGDGELATVVVEQAGDGFLVHDAGFSAMRLTAAGISFSKNVVQRLNDSCQRYRCTFSDGRVFSQSGLTEIAQVVCLVANASRSVADYVYEIRRHAEHDFRLTVFDRLKEIVGDRVRETDEFRGKSGRRYRVPILLDVTRARAQNFVTTIAHRQAVSQSFTMFYDLGAAYPEIERDAIYDDTADIREEDRALLKSVGTEVIGLMEAQHRFREIVRHA
jgi:hypothetical protein